MKFLVLALFIALGIDLVNSAEEVKGVAQVEIVINLKSIPFYDKKHNKVNICDLTAYVERTDIKIYNCEKKLKTFGKKMYTTVQRYGRICHAEVDPKKHPEKGYYKCLRGPTEESYLYESYAKKLTIYKYSDDSEVNKCDVKFTLSTKNNTILEKNQFKNCETAINSSDDKVYGKFQTDQHYCKAILDPSLDADYGKMKCIPKYKPCYCMNPYYNMSEKDMKSMMKKKYKLIFFYKKVTQEKYTKAFCKCE